MKLADIVEAGKALPPALLFLLLVIVLVFPIIDGYLFINGHKWEGIGLAVVILLLASGVALKWPGNTGTTTANGTADKALDVADNALAVVDKALDQSAEGHLRAYRMAEAALQKAYERSEWLETRIENMEEERKTLTEPFRYLLAKESSPDAPPGLAAALAEAEAGRIGKAEDILATILAHKEAEGDVAHKEAAEAARHLGALAYLHDTKAAISHYRKATELDPDHPGGWNDLGLLLNRTGSLAEAEQAFHKVLGLEETAVDLKWEAAASSNLGLIYFTQGDLNQAKKMHEKSLALGMKLGRKDVMASSYGNLGIIYATQGNLELAEEMHHRSLELSTELDSKEEIANQYGNLGNVYYSRGDLAQAEKMHQKSFAIYSELGHKRGMAGYYDSMGNIYLTKKNFDQAEEAFRKSLFFNENLGLKAGIAVNYGNLGTLYAIRGDYNQAEEMFEKSLAIDNELGNKLGMASAYGNLGNLYLIGGNFDRAEDMYTKCLDYNKELGHQEGVGIQHHNLADLFVKKGDVIRAHLHEKTAVAVLEKIGSGYAEKARSQLTVIELLSLGGGPPPAID